MGLIGGHSSPSAAGVRKPHIKVLRSQRFRRLSKEGFWVVLGQAMAVGGSLVGVRMLTGLLSPGAYGELALGMTAATLVGQTVLGPLGHGVTRFYAPAVEQDDLRGYLTSVERWVWSATVLIVLITLLTVVSLWIAGLTQWIVIATAALIFATLSGYNSILSGIQNAARQRPVVALHQGMEPWARYLITAALLLWLGTTSAVAAVGYAIAVGLVVGSQYLCFRKIIPQKQTGAAKETCWKRGIWNYSLPFAFWGIFYWAQSASDRWALQLFSAADDVGLYAVLFQLGYYPMSSATGIAMQFLAPIFYQKAGNASDRQRNAAVTNLSWRLTASALGISFAAFLGAFLYHKQIFKIFVHHEYAPVSHLLPWMLLAGGLFAAGQTITLNLMSQMKTHLIMRAKITTALFGITFNFVGAYLFGIEGIVCAGVLFSLLYLVWMALFCVVTPSVETPQRQNAR